MFVLDSSREESDRFEEARAVLQPAHARFPDDGEILRWIGWNHEFAGDPVGARRAWIEAIEHLDAPNTIANLKNRIDQR